MKLSVKGTKGSIDKIRRWKKIADNQDKVLEKLAEHGKRELDKAHNVVIGVNQALHQGHAQTVYIKSDMQSHIEQSGNTASIVATGKNFLFFEFGAGVKYNDPRVWENVLGVSVPVEISDIGTYGLGYGSQQSWMFNEDGITYRTSGYQASQGFALAIDEIVSKVNEVIREVGDE